MTKEITYGQVKYKATTFKELEEMGAKVNPYVYIGNSFQFCVSCKGFNYMYAMQLDDKTYTVCRECDTHVEAIGNVNDETKRNQSGN